MPISNQNNDCSRMLPIPAVGEIDDSIYDASRRVARRPAEQTHITRVSFR